MAARDNQGLQIALIIFVMLTIVLSVTTFMFFRKLEEAVIERDKAVAKSKESLTAETVAQEETKALKKILGAPTESKDVIEKNYADDMKTYGANFKEADQHYRQLVKYLHTELQERDARFVDAKVREEQLKAKIAADEKAKLAEIEKFKDNLDKSVVDLKNERTNFNQSRGDFKKTVDTTTTVLAAKSRELDDKTKKADEEIQTISGQLIRAQKVIDGMKGQLWNKEQYADMPRGKITWVNQRGRVVWLNVGLADGLRRQITFKILGADETNLKDGKSKGSVEVTRLLDKHLAEARILDDDLSDPIVPGDQIFSQIWIPGRIEHFALAGFMDIDGDSESDRKRIKSLITVNGGVIDAEVADDGTRTGELSVNTHYLVVGVRPTDKNTTGAFLASYSKMIAEAESLGIRKISLDQFLDNIGYQPEEHTTPLDSSATAADFKMKPHGGVLRQSNSPFKNRRPTPTSAKPSAY